MRFKSEFRGAAVCLQTGHGLVVSSLSNNVFMGPDLKMLKIFCLDVFTQHNCDWTRDSLAEASVSHFVILLRLTWAAAWL